jgi:nicotinate-nucleotide adenylyltransferase
MKVGLFFGSFNPIHVGHLIIANHLVEHSDLDQIWFVVTPHNPFKKKSSLLDNYQRLEMVELATKSYTTLEPCNIEFNLPQPNYTVNTLAHLREKHPKHHFSIIMGEDNLKSFHKWKNYTIILEDFHVIVYPRISAGIIETQFTNHSNISRIEAPIIELSSTLVRKGIKNGKNVQPMLDDRVWTYIDQMGHYS